MVQAKDPMGREIYWFTVVPIREPEEGTDRWAVGSFAWTMRPSYWRIDWRVQRIPLGSGGKLTFTRCNDDCRISTLSTDSTCGCNFSKTGSSCSAGVLKAIPLAPEKTACLAAAKVPECQMALPRLRPRLIPESTRSAPPHKCRPRATQSAGVPFTR